ncbi:unnamed protein product [Arabis nemorensis]|uniref:Mediator of RNA polymerase II transcription subunit 10 n=1 Tax=Arabis nemorensis TaxID=586526 RepID=A0A565ASK7_9BRAS|nr:unnamed protein product [Arabis nemorensis]
MAKLSEKCSIQVPMELLSLIDDVKNPDGFLEELEQTFPDEVDMYREIRASSASEAQLQSVLPNGDSKVKSEL